MTSFASPIADDDDPTPTLKQRPLTDLDVPSTGAGTGETPAPTRSPVPAAASEAIRQLLNRFEMSTGKQLPSVIAVTSALRGEGVTTLSRALASILSTDFDTNVAWIDLSWTTKSKNGSIPRSAPGISEVLRGSTDLEHIVFSDPAQPRVQLIPLGDQSPGDQARLARNPQLTDVLTELLESNSHVVIDAGAVLDSTEAPITIRQADAYLLVVRHGTTTGRQVQAATDELSAVPTLGAVLNQYRSRTPSFIRDRLDH
jgi:polysaccharide biosynthesis transport protein